MLTTQPQARTRPGSVRKSAGVLPLWVSHLINTDDTKRLPPAFVSGDAIELSVTESDRLILVSARVANAAALPPLMLQRRTAEAYDAIRGALTPNKTWQPVRIWNWIPGIHTIVGDGVHRYMVFNAGRYAAYYDWYSGGRHFETAMATATAVGHDGTDLIIHVLATERPGAPVENPRQIQSYRYSDRFGPMPPCFARATLAPKNSLGLPDLLIGGTASVCGEVSRHHGDAAAQTQETIVNLAHLIAEGSRRWSQKPATDDRVDTARELRRFDSLCIFHLRPSDSDAILEIIWPYIDHLAPSCVEFVRADICRPELLVEIEGTASLT